MKVFKIVVLSLFTGVSLHIYTMNDNESPQQKRRPLVSVVTPTQDVMELSGSPAPTPHLDDDHMNPNAITTLLGHAKKHTSSHLRNNDENGGSAEDILAQLSRQLHGTSVSPRRKSSTSATEDFFAASSTSSSASSPFPRQKLQQRRLSAKPIQLDDDEFDLQRRSVFSQAASSSSGALEDSVQVPRVDHLQAQRRFRSAAHKIQAVNALRQTVESSADSSDDDLSEKASKKAVHDFQNQVGQSTKHLYLATGGTATGAVLLAACKWHQNSQRSSLDTFKPHDGDPKRGLGSLVGSVATGGVSDMVTTGCYVLIAMAGAYGLKQCYNLIHAPIKHTEKMDEIHREKVDALSTAHRKAMNRQAEDFQRSLHNLEGHYQQKLERIELQQRLHLETTDSHGRAISQLDHRSKTQEQGMQQVKHRQAEFREAYNKLLSDFERETAFLRTIDTTDTRQTDAINDMHKRLHVVEQKMPTVEERLQLQGFTFPQDQTEDLLQRRRAQSSAHALRARALSTSAILPTGLQESVHDQQQVSQLATNPVARVEQQLIPKPKETGDGCCGCKQQ